MRVFWSGALDVRGGEHEPPVVHADVVHGAQRALVEHRGGRTVCAARGGRALRWLRREGGVAAHAAEAHELLTEAAPGEHTDEHVERGERVNAVGGELPVGRRQAAPVPHDVRQLDE